VKRTTGTGDRRPFHSAVRFTDYILFTLQPSSKLLGYCRSSADADCLKYPLCKAAVRSGHFHKLNQNGNKSLHWLSCSDMM